MPPEWCFEHVTDPSDSEQGTDNDSDAAVDSDDGLELDGATFSMSDDSSDVPDDEIDLGPVDSNSKGTANGVQNMLHCIMQCLCILVIEHVAESIAGFKSAHMDVA